MQIHADIDETFWQQLLDGTMGWETPRTQASIARYALQEFYSEMEVESTGIPVPEAAPPGKRHIQCRTLDPDEVNEWAQLAAKYGSASNALKVALAFLHACLTYEEEEVEEDPDPWVDYHRLSEADLMLQTIDTLRRYANQGLNIPYASNIRGGKSVLVQRILAVRSSA